MRERMWGQPPAAHLWRGALLGLGLGLLAGCSVERRYRTLSFFFDGVPDPNAPVETAEDEGAPGETASAGMVTGVPETEEKAILSLGSIHPPYANHECDACHAVDPLADKGGLTFQLAGPGQELRLLTEPLEELCVSCHDEYGAETAAAEKLWLHGPVAAGACTVCHSPHRSSHERLLLTRQPRTLCLRCHDRDRLATNLDHPTEEDMEGADCTECHNPHHGASRFLL